MEGAGGAVRSEVCHSKADGLVIQVMSVFFSNNLSTPFAKKSA